MTVSYKSKATGPVVTKFNEEDVVEPTGAEGIKLYSNISSPMTNMAAMPMYG